MFSTPTALFSWHPPAGWQEFKELWRHALLRRLRASGALTDWHVARLQCPLCSSRLRRIAVVETKADILAILTPLGLARPHERPFAHGPPRPEVTVLVAADSGAAYPVDPPRCEPRLPYPRPRDEPLRYRVQAVEPGEEFDHTGFELPPAPEAAVAAGGQGQLFNDDYTQPDAADGAPVFWNDSVGQTFPADDFVQADRSEAV